MDARPAPTLGILQKEEKLVQLRNLSLQVPKGAYLLEKDAVGKALGSANRPWHLDFLECALLVPADSSEKPGAQSESLKPGLYLVWLIHPRSGVPFEWSNRTTGVVRELLGTTGADSDAFGAMHPTTFYTTLYAETHAYRLHFQYAIANGNLIVVNYSDRSSLPGNFDKSIESTAYPEQADRAQVALKPLMQRIALEGLDPSRIQMWINETFRKAKPEGVLRLAGKEVQLPKSVRILTETGGSFYSVDTGRSPDVEYKVLGDAIWDRSEITPLIYGQLFLLTPREAWFENPTLADQKEYLFRISKWLPWLKTGGLEVVKVGDSSWLGFRGSQNVAHTPMENVLFLRWIGNAFVGFNGASAVLSLGGSEEDLKQKRSSVEENLQQFLEAIEATVKGTPEPNRPVSETAGPDARRQLDELWKKFQSQGPFRCEPIFTLGMGWVDANGKTVGSTEQTYVGTYWSKGPYSRTDLMNPPSNHPSQTIVQPPQTIVHPDAVYEYLPDKGKYKKTKVDAGFSRKQSYSYGGPASHGAPLILGTETLDGKKTLIVQALPNTNDYSRSIKQIGSGKAWIWEDTGIVVRWTGTTQTHLVDQGTDKGSFSAVVTCEYKNFSFRDEDVPDSLFEVPPDKVIEEETAPEPSDPKDHSKLQ